MSVKFQGSSPAGTSLLYYKNQHRVAVTKQQRSDKNPLHQYRVWIPAHCSVKGFLFLGFAGLE